MTNRDCTHGQLARSCNICDLEQEINNLKAKLQEMIEQPAANTPIQELMAQYSDECCNFSDLHWLRETARRLVTTMPDSQARCILFALAEQPASVPDEQLQAAFDAGATAAREECAKACQDVVDSGMYDGRQQYAAAACRDEICARA